MWRIINLKKKIVWKSSVDFSEVVLSHGKTHYILHSALELLYIYKSKNSFCSMSEYLSKVRSYPYRGYGGSRRVHSSLSTIIAFTLTAPTTHFDPLQSPSLSVYWTAMVTTVAANIATPSGVSRPVMGVPGNSTAQEPHGLTFLLAHVLRSLEVNDFCCVGAWSNRVKCFSFSHARPTPESCQGGHQLARKVSSQTVRGICWICKCTKTKTGKVSLGVKNLKCFFCKTILSEG